MWSGGGAVATPKQGTWNAERSESKIDNFQHVCIALRTVIKYSIYDRNEMFITTALFIIIANKKKSNNYDKCLNNCRGKRVTMLILNRRKHFGICTAINMYLR